MISADVKGQIHEAIENIDDPEVLQIIHDLAQRAYPATATITLSTEQKVALEKSQADLLHGRIMDADEADQQTINWLNSAK